MITVLSLALVVPYVVAYSLVPLTVNDGSLKLLILMCPTSMSMMIVIKYMKVRARPFQSPCDGIEIEKNLTGIRIMNYNHTNSVSLQNLFSYLICF